MTITEDTRPALGLPQIQSLAAADMAAVDALIRRRLSSDVVLINQIADHIISAGGKRLRPMLVMLAGHAVGGAGPEHHQLAAIIEFIHTSTLLHDDVVDESSLRRGRSTANALWGNAPSVLVGDFLYSRSFQLMVELDRMSVMQILADTTNRIAEGEVLQLLHVHNPDTDEAAYLRVIERKTAVLFAAGTRLGALASGVDEATQQALFDYGMHLGYAFQIADDVLDYSANAEELGKNLGDDLAEGKATLPLIHAIRHSDAATREVLRAKLPTLLAQEFPEIRGRVKLLPNGPPVPYPVQFRVVGPDPKVLRLKADEIKAQMRLNPNTRGVNDNWNESVKSVRLEVDQAKARALGVSSQSIAQASRTLLTGSAVGQYREGDKLIEIVLRQPLAERDALSDLGQAYVPTASGRFIPLLQIATPVLAWEPGVMWREGRQFAITVQADIAEGLQGATVTTQLLPELKKTEATWQGQGLIGYRIEVAGAVEESAKGSASIAAGVPVMLFITFTLLMLQLQSFSRAMLVFLTGPLGMAGVAGALLVLDRPFGFVALLGVIALMGMIQRNSVILIDQIEQDRAAGMAPWQAIVESAVRRLRPIVLTAAAAVLAMIPLSRSIFWGPMAVAIMGGLIVATALTLLALPAMYAAWFRIERPNQARA